MTRGSVGIAKGDIRVNWEVVSVILVFIFLPLMFVIYGWIYENGQEHDRQFVNSCESINYRVLEHDTLWSIATLAMDKGLMESNVDIRQNVDYLQIKNGFARNGLKEGDVVKIPITKKRG